MTYEVYGPNRVAMVIHVTTDNKNRTNAAIKSWANKNNGSIANTGAFDYLFHKIGVVHFQTDLPQEKVMDIVFETQAEDVEVQEDGTYHAICEPNEDIIWEIREKLESQGMDVIEANVVNVPQTKVHLDEEQREKFEQSLDHLYELEPDIQNMYHNAVFD